MSRVSFRQDGAVGHLRLTRGDAHNAIDLQWNHDLLAALDACAAADGVRAVLISADGPSFTVGGDLGHIGARADRLAEELAAMITPFHEGLARIAELPVPVVAAVQGPCAGGGIGLIWAADIVIAAEDLKLVTGFSALGLSGDGGTSFYLPRLIGTRRALEVYLEGRALSAVEALEWGLVNRVVPGAELVDHARATAERLAAGPTAAFGEMRALLRTSGTRTLREQLAAELEAMQRCAQTADAPAAVVAFTRGERPGFSGR